MSTRVPQLRRPTAPRLIAAGALAIAVLALAVLLLGSGPGYTIRARFLDASGLVVGDSVDLGGRATGSVGSIGLTPDGLAEVTMSLDAGTSLPVGSRAAIRALGQAGVANHYVALTPGPAGGRALPSGSVLPATQTSSIVNYDAMLDAFGPPQRAALQTLIGEGAQIYAGSGARAFRTMLSRLAPGLRGLDGLTGELAGDRGAIATVIRDGRVDAGAVASRSSDLIAAVANTASSLGAIASERAALGDALSRAPAVLARATSTLTHAGAALTALTPTLRAVPPAAGPLRGFLTRLRATLPPATTAVRQLNAELPGLRTGLNGLATLAPSATRAVASAGTALRVARPIVRAIRFYGSDLLLGVFQGLAGVATANYDEWGHYARLEFTQPYQTSLGGPLSSLFAKPLLPSVFNLRTHLLRRCPGGNSPPAPDGSNPWVPDPSICTPADDMPLSVDFP